MYKVEYTQYDIAKLEQERNDYKQQRDELSEKLDKECNDNYKLEGQFHDMTKQRDSLIKDVEKLKELKDQLIFENRYLEEQVKSLRNKYTNLTEHIRLKALHNPSIHRYIELKNFIKELEG